MDKKVVVSIKSKQIVDNEEENIELITTGKFYNKDNAFYVVYDETEISGMEGTTTTVKIGKEEVNLIRFGTTNTRMSFKRGVKDVSLYRTPYGVLEIVINPYAVEIDVDDSGGEVRMGYGLESGGLTESTNELFIKINVSQ